MLVGVDFHRVHLSLEDVAAEPVQCYGVDGCRRFVHSMLIVFSGILV